MIIFRGEELLGTLTGKLKTRLDTGAVRIVEAGGTKVEYHQDTQYHVFDVVECERIEAGIGLDDLTLDELNQVVDYLDVTTSASTKAGLISAINNHLNGNP